MGGALWEGQSSRLGNTFWRAAEAMVASDLIATAGKEVFQRARPRQGNNPDAWFQGRSHQSFPSGEVAHITGIVTPFIAEYGADQPWVYGLALLLAYVGVARMKSHAHWQTDVLTSLTVGVGTGLYVHHHQPGWTATLLPKGLGIGWRQSF